MGIESNGAGIKGVIFDYGEVLCHRPTEEQVLRMAKVFGTDAKAFRRLWEKNRGAFDRGDLTGEGYWKMLASDAGTELSAEQLEHIFKWDVEMYAAVNGRMVAWLRQLRNGGIKTALLSNMHPAMIDYLRANFEWLDQFDFITFSAEVHLIKPDRAIYEHTLRGLGLRAGETLFVDDREANIQAARELGIHAVRFRSVEQLGRDLEEMQFRILPALEGAE